jgi:hypothetical protein
MSQLNGKSRLKMKHNFVFSIVQYHEISILYGIFLIGIFYW